MLLSIKTRPSGAAHSGFPRRALVQRLTMFLNLKPEPRFRIPNKLPGTRTLMELISRSPLLQTLVSPYLTLSNLYDLSYIRTPILLWGCPALQLCHKSSCPPCPVYLASPGNSEALFNSSSEKSFPSTLRGCHFSPLLLSTPSVWTVTHFTSLECISYKNKDLLFSFPLEKRLFFFPRTGSPMSQGCS